MKNIIASFILFIPLFTYADFVGEGAISRGSSFKHRISLEIIENDNNKVDVILKYKGEDKVVNFSGEVRKDYLSVKATNQPGTLSGRLQFENGFIIAIEGFYSPNGSSTNPRFQLYAEGWDYLYENLYKCSTDGHQISMNLCAGKIFKVTKEHFEKVFEESLPKFSNKREVAQNAQAAWVEYVEFHCASQKLWGGRMDAMLYYQCMTDKYRERERELSDYICHPSVGCQ